MADPNPGSGPNPDGEPHFFPTKSPPFGATFCDWVKRPVIPETATLYFCSTFCNRLTGLQMAVAACHAGGRGFESRPLRHETPDSSGVFLLPSAWIWWGRGQKTAVPHQRSPPVATPAANDVQDGNERLLPSITIAASAKAQTPQNRFQCLSGGCRRRTPTNQGGVAPPRRGTSPNPTLQPSQ